MLVVEKFQRVNEPVDAVIVALGVVLGLRIVPISVQTTQSITALLAASLAVGGVAAVTIRIAYRIAFPAGVPKSPTSDIISPNYYGQTAWRHFAKFAKALVSSFLTGLVVWSLFRVMGGGRKMAKTKAGACMQLRAGSDFI